MLDHLKTPEARLAYLEAAFEEGDPAFITVALGDVARSIGMNSVAKEADVTREALYKALISLASAKSWGSSVFFGALVTAVLEWFGLRLSLPEARCVSVRTRHFRCCLSPVLHRVDCHASSG